MINLLAKKTQVYIIHLFLNILQQLWTELNKNYSQILGPFCGFKLPAEIAVNGSDSILVVFYSDLRGRRRNKGIVRMQFSVSGTFMYDHVR